MDPAHKVVVSNDRLEAGVDQFDDLTAAAIAADPQASGRLDHRLS